MSRGTFGAIAIGATLAGAFVGCFPSLDALTGGAVSEAGTPDVLDDRVLGDSSSDGPCDADVSRDARNCGTCGRSCLGGACNDGRCAAVRLATDLAVTTGPAGSALVVDDDAAWLLADNVLTRVKLTENPQAEAFSRRAWNMDADRDFLYLVTYDTTPPNTGAIVKLPKATPGGNAEPLSPKSALSVHIGVGGDLVAFGSYGSVRAVTKTGADAGHRIDVDAGGGGDGLGNLAPSAGRVYAYRAVGNGEIRELTAAGGTNTASTEDVDNDARIRADESGVVWAVKNAGTVQLRRADGVIVDVIKGAPATTFGGLALDATHVYATTPRNGPGSILRAPRTGAGTFETLATTTTAPREIAVSSKFIVWMTSDGSGKQSLWAIAR